MPNGGAGDTLTVGHLADMANSLAPPPGFQHSAVTDKLFNKGRKDVHVIPTLYRREADISE
jgi:hypothetical protein